MERVMAYFGLSLEPEHPVKPGEVKPAWLGLNLTVKAGQVTVSTHMSESPLRHLLMPGDEIIAINGMRTASTKALETALKGQVDQEVTITYAHEGMIRECTLKLSEGPKHNVKLVGKGNKNWRSYIATRQSN
jgi:predicted metalloprotease with PDZ domain